MLIGILLVGLLLLVIGATVLSRRRREQSLIQEHTITPEALHTLIEQGSEVIVLDARLPLDLLANSEIIPGAVRIAPKAVHEIETRLPKEGDIVFYCTCTGQKSSRKALLKALALRFTKARLLSGGLDAWKSKGYQVEPYTTPFHLDTQQ